MGKVQKKAIEKHKLSLSPAFTEFIDKTVSLPVAQLPQHLAAIPTRWPFPRGDLYNWIDVLDRFDDILQKFGKAYGLCNGPQTRPFGVFLLLDFSPDLNAEQLRDLGFGSDGDRHLVESILSFSRLLLEKCGNRTLYNSTERLNDLLNTTSLPLLYETLRLTSLLALRYAERPSQTSSQAHFYHFDLERIQKLAGPIPRPNHRRTPQSPTKTTKTRDKTSQPRLRRASTAADPNDFKALARSAAVHRSSNSAKGQDLDWSASAAVRVTWPAPVPIASASRPSTSRLTSSDLPSSPTPLRQQSFVANASKPSSVDPGIANASSTDLSGSRYVDFSAADIAASTISDILQNAPEDMPPTARYELLYKLRIAYALLDSPEARSLLLQIRLTAICIVGQVYNEEELTSKFFAGDSNASARQQLVLHLAGLLRDSKQEPSLSQIHVQCLAMETMTILSRFRQMSSEILAALSSNSSHGLMMSLVQRGLADISQDGDLTDNEIGDDWRDAIFMMWTIFMAQSGPHHARSSEQYVHKSLITAYASALQKTTAKALRVHLRVLEFLKTLFHHFKDGLQVLNANGAFATACEATWKLSQEALELARSSRGMPEQFKNQNTDYKIPYLHQQVLRSAVELVDDISGHQGNHADRALRGFIDSASLLSAFRLILSHMDEFGAHTWSKVVKAVCGFLNNEPTSFTVVSEAGIISTLLSVIQPQVPTTSSTSERQSRTISAVPSTPTIRLPPIADAITNLASAFGAICLLEAGHNQFVASNVLERFFELFESPEHIKAIKDSNTFLTLGSTFDELVRHHPGLKDPVVSAVITMVSRVQYICKSKLKRVGAGPKLWRTDDSLNFSVVGGPQDLLHEDTPGASNLQSGPASFSLPNGDTLNFGSMVVQSQDLSTDAFSDKDADGLTALDYARPVIGFLAAFFDGRYMCKEIMSAGATDMILDFVTLPTLPVVEDTFSDALLMQELTAVIRTMAEERPYLVLPLLVDRARFICKEVLPTFVDFHPDSIQCYFSKYLGSASGTSATDSGASESDQSPVSGTRLVKGLMNIYCIAKVLAEVFTTPAYPARASHNSILVQVNIADILAEMVSSFGKLSAACCREEISLLSLIPKTSLDATRPGHYSTGDHDVDAILDVSDSPDSEDKGNEKKDEGEQKHTEDTPAFRNLKTLRYLLTETPASIATLFSRIGSSFSGRKKPETIIKQKIHLVSTALAQALTHQLDPPFLSSKFLHNDDEKYRDWRFKYFTVVLSRLRDSLWEESANIPSNSIRQSFVVDCFRRVDGVAKLTKIGTQFFDELRSCQVAKPVFAANVGLKMCLELFDDLTHAEMVSSQQTAYLKNVDVTRPYYFNPSQLLLEVRMECLNLTRRIWDSDYAEQASNDVIRRLVAVLKHILEGVHEEHAVPRAEDYPKTKEHERRKFMIDKTKAASLKDKGYDPDLIDEALYRCNVVHTTQIPYAEEYCKALNGNPQRRRLPIPDNEVEYKGIATSTAPQLTASLSAMDTTPGPTTTIFEDTSLDEDVAMPHDATLTDEASIVTDTGPQNAGSVEDRPAENESTSHSTMSINNILNAPQPPATISETHPVYSRQTIDNERSIIRDQLPERCNNILSNHPSLTFDLNDLLCAAASRLDDDAAQEWWKSTTDLLISSLISQSLDDELSEVQGKKIAATAHLVGLLCSNESFKPSMLSVLQEHMDSIIGFLQVSSQRPPTEDSSPWVAPVLLILEKLLALDADPDEVIWSDPTDLENCSEPRLTHRTVISPGSKELLFSKLIEILPRVGKDRSMAISIARVLVILTRDRPIAQRLGEKKHLQKLFLMVKQLAGGVDDRVESTLMVILRHIIEDDETIKSIMASEITAYFRSRATPRLPDFTSYLRELNYLALRSPALFVAVSNAKIKLSSWTPGQAVASSTLTLREGQSEPTSTPDATNSAEPMSTEEPPADSVETSAVKTSEESKLPDLKVPIVEHPDGVIHFILSELLSYRDIEDKDPVVDGQNENGTTNEHSVTEDAAISQAVKEQQEKLGKNEKPRFKADDHPIFMYRCFLLHSLTELLYSYNQTKIEFISFSRKADPLAATPSKWRSGVLNYLLNNLVSSNYIDKDESINCKKRVTTSEWATRVLVALCTKTGEKELVPARYTAPRHIEDNDDEPDLIYVRRFVLDHAIKSFKETISLPESMQVRYGRLLCLADLFNKLLAKPGGPEGSVFSNNTSYKRLARLMLEKNLIAVLTAAVSDIDLSFPGSKKVVKFILRPLKELTSAATYLSTHSPESFPQIENSPAENISSASSEVSEMDDEREETPDLYRNSALGMRDPARQSEMDSDESEGDEDMYEDDYDDEEMEFDDEMAAPGNDGEVVSDEELEDVVDGSGPAQGLSGDVPMDIEFVVDHHHHHHHHGGDSEDSSDDEDDSEDGDEDDENDDDIEIEIDEGDIEHGDSDGHTDEEVDEDGWEDEEGDDAEDDDDDAEDVNFDEDLHLERNDNATAHLNNLLRALGGSEMDGPILATGNNVVVQANDPEDPDDEDDQDEDGDMDENDGMDYDQGFDMMLDGNEDFDENEEWGWEEPPPPVFRRSRHARPAAMPGFFNRRILNEHEMHHHVLGTSTRHHRHATSGRSAGDEGINPLLQRPDTVMGGVMMDPSYTLSRHMNSRRTGDLPPGMPLVIPGGPRGPAYAIPMHAGGTDMPGHGAILDAIMGAIQRGDQELMQNGRIQFNIQAPTGDIRDMFRSSAVPAHFLARQAREDPQRSVQFIPMLTTTRWLEEARMLFGKSLVTKSQPIQRWLMSKLVPLAQEEEKERLRKLEQQRIENERVAKEEEERRAKEEEERKAKEAAEAAEQARVEEEARLAAASQEQADRTDPHDQPSDAMEGVQSGEEPHDAEGAPQQPARIFTTIRGAQVDITGLDIDLEYLEALPEDFREEVITQQYQVRREQAQEEGNDASEIDPDFLDALPEEIREEIRHQEAAAQRRRERERARQEAQSTGALPQTGMMDNDDFFATLDPALRRIILAEQPPEILNDLNPQHAAEGRAHARSHFFHHRLPMQRELDTARNRRELAQREARRQQVVQLIDKAGVATLLRLMFLHQQGSLKQNLLNILSDVCGNRQTRYEVVSLLLVILREGSVDVTAVERSLASLSIRAKAGSTQKTPQPLKRTLSMQPHGGISEDVTPVLVVQQCLNTLTHICHQNGHVRSLFLREVDVTSGNKGKGKVKVKGKEGKATTHPVNDLISLLDRGLIMNNSGCLLSLASLLAIVTLPIAALMRQEKERQKAEATEEKDDKTAKGESHANNPDISAATQEDVTMEDASAPLSHREAQDTAQPAETEPEVAKEGTETTRATEQEKKKPFEPPAITQHNLKLITDIFVAPECGTDTFHQTLETLQSLSHIPEASTTFGNELIKHVHSLTKAICVDLEDLLPAIRNAQSSTDVQGVAAAKFSASTSDQVKLLRVLQALDYLSAPKKEEETSSADIGSPTILTLSYDSLSLGVLWRKLSECLTLVEEKGDTISFANILLPLIESLMVVCKHTTLKDTTVAQVKEGAVTGHLDGEEEDLEELFFKFTSEHRKILNDIVRQSPKLMQGQFAILVKNSKVLDFDNKRNYFNKQIHSRHHAQRHPQPPLQLNIRRDQVFIDSYKALYFKNPEEMKYGKLNIRFNGEEGVDAGGVTREWFQVLARGMFDPNYALWQPVASDRTTFHPSPLSAVNPEHLMYFKFIGRIIGKALHEGRVLDCHFSRAVYKRILGKSPNLKDLESNDMDYYKSLCWILENDITDIISEEFCVIENEFGIEKVIDLIPGGRDISVTEDNKKEYVQRLVEYRLTDSVKEQLDSFLGGFHDIIPADLISIFNEQELELLISGLPEIDVDDWKANTEYHNYNPSSQQIVWFWRIVKAMTNEERAKLLQFITGTSKVPLNGFKELEGVSGLTKCNIHKDPSINRLPTSHTCFNQLDLPAYESFELMKHNITTAISLGADYFGFA